MDPTCMCGESTVSRALECIFAAVRLIRLGNFALGTGDSSDKAFADRVNLLTQNQASGRPDPMQRFFHVGVKDVHMAKLHTAAVTTESKGNLSLCGFGANGR